MTFSLLPLYHLIRQQKIIVLGIAAFILIGLIWLLSGPTPYQVHTVNVASNSFGVAWITKQSAPGCVWWGTTWPFSLKKQCDNLIGTTHLVALRQLNSNTPHWYLITGSGRLYVKTLTTISTFVPALEPPKPQAAYGSIMDVNGQPIKQGIILVYPRFAQNIYPQAARTNAVGNFVVDIGTFSSVDTGFVIEGGAGLNQWEALIVDQHTSPFPPLEVSVYE